jgi:hypothetical protein
MIEQLNRFSGSPISPEGTLPITIDGGQSWTTRRALEPRRTRRSDFHTDYSDGLLVLLCHLRSSTSFSFSIHFK